MCILDGLPWGSAVKNPPAKQEIQVRSPGREDLLESGMAACPGILAWEIPWRKEPSRLPPTVFQRVKHDLVAQQQQ